MSIHNESSNTNVPESRPEYYPDGGCPQCASEDLPHIVRYRNVRKDHYVCCERHKVYWHVGRNLYSGWTHEPEGNWIDNANELLSEYTKVKPAAIAKASDYLEQQLDWLREAFGSMNPRERAEILKDVQRTANCEPFMVPRDDGMLAELCERCGRGPNTVTALYEDEDGDDLLHVCASCEELDRAP